MVIEHGLVERAFTLIFIQDYLKDRIIFLGENVNDTAASLVYSTAFILRCRGPQIKDINLLHKQSGGHYYSRYGYL